jgi:hypothetical protein
VIGIRSRSRMRRDSYSNKRIGGGNLAWRGFGG